MDDVPVVLVHGFASSFERNWQETGIGDGVFARTDPEPLARAVETGQAAPDAGPAAAALAYFAATPGNDPAALAACLRGQGPPLTEADVAAIQVPVLVVLGERDFARPADRLVAALPDARLLVLPGNDHFGTPKDFRFVQAALEFVG